ncbi:pyruvate kinase [bacterium]|nr:pyruvate kinase [Rhodopirellula sp.]MDA7893429.1 pyruvate kinase [bacterium]MDA7904725.1 pyruvate kinase [Rhodopirellula sp.]MDB4506054.1 pyruvate kinase [bacterium]
MPRPSLDDARTKIVATVGPACESVHQLEELIEAGVDVFRINTAHGNREQHEIIVRRIREAATIAGFPVGILLDLAGPKIRLGQLHHDPLICEEGMKLTFVTETTDQPREVTSTYERLIEELQPGDRVMLADGTVSLRVEQVQADRAECVVTGGGSVRSRQGINLPGVQLSVPALLERDVDNAIWAARNEIDFISLSFVRSPDDVRQLKGLLHSHGSNALVIAKIEKPEALEHLEDIVENADGIMVARGDLGVEIDVAKTPVAQKRIIRVCREKMKPVIVATQMLESMHTSTRPTRAEASDVANAILDGADACMLSGETAIGDHPALAVTMMSRIMKCTEQEMMRGPNRNHQISYRVHPITSAVTQAATHVAETIEAKLIVIATRSGNTAWVNSQSRSLIPTVGASESQATLRRMNLLWGIKPLASEHLEDTSRFIDQMCRWGHEHTDLRQNDHIVFVTGTGVVDKAHNLMVVHTVE